VYKKPKIEKNKMGGTKVVMYLTIGYRLDADGSPLAFVHWLCVPPQRSNKPLSDRIEEWEKEDKTEKRKLKEKYTEAYVTSLTAEGLKKELSSICLRSPATAAASMRETLIRVGRSGSRVGELRQRKQGGQEKGALRPHTQTSYYFSEYLSQCLGTYATGEDLWSEGDNECKLSADLGIRGCPDGGKREYMPKMRETTLMLDNAGYHQYTTENTVSAFHEWVQDKLGIKGVLFSPAYSSWFNPTEYANSFIKRYVRRFNPQTIPDLLQRIREATQKITGKFIQGWYKKASFKTGPEVLRPADPNAGVVDRCTLPANARFDRREVIVCVDESGSVKREKKKRHSRWSKYTDEIEGTLENVSRVRRSGVRPRKRPRIESCFEPTDGSRLRWVGIGPEPPGLVHGSSAGLFQSGGDMAEIEKICDEKKTPAGKEYLVRWKGFDSSDDEWLKEKDIQGLGSLLQYYKERNKRVTEESRVREHQEEAS
jgi:transposase